MINENDTICKSNVENKDAALQTVFYGYFVNYLWRNEKNGGSYFKIATKQKLVLKEQSESQIVKRNESTKEDETWNLILCDGSLYNVPFYREYTPVKITGYFMDRHHKGLCWDFKILDIVEATGEETTTIKYLASLPDINYETAVEIVSCYGADIFDFAKKSDAPERLVRDIGIRREIAENMISIINSTVEERKLFAFLAPMHISYAYCVKAVKLYGDNAFNEISTNPYISGAKVGLTFEECDKISRASGATAVSKKRIKAACRQTINRIGNSGHTWISQYGFFKALNYTLRKGAYENSTIPMSLAISSISGDIQSECIDGVEAIYSRRLHEAEINTAKNILRLSENQELEPYDSGLVEYAEKACGMHYGTQQREAFSTVLRKRGVKIVTGGPGTGKTTTIKGILLAYQKMHPDHVIKLCAPTGRAAQRMAESTEMPAVTIHRLLDYRPYGHDIVHKDASNPIEADLIVVDEMSMTDIELFDMLLGAIKSGTTLVLVGDIHQLESVGAGAVLHDLLKVSDDVIQKIMLTEVFRQKGGSPIIENALRINSGNVDLKECPDFQIIQTKNEEESLEKIMEIMQKCYNPKDPFECQILCPALDGLSGIDNCNRTLQKILNPRNRSKRLVYGKTTFQENDKIIMMQNNPALDYFNGDIGTIKAVVNNELIVSIRDNEITLTRDMLNEVRLAYGMTIHKSQGSEFPYVIVVMPMEPQIMLVRNLLYTAVTRAKKGVLIINEGSAMQTAIMTDRSEERRTLLNNYLPSK
ncbi:AAA family ATPase [Extibacter muris]|uniref:SF1B family DNA helicase RecD2 n=1 Tax=Extibacter muris TaxID=1796622 RepID=UPI0021C5D39D|nr:AAA family ATPase [Extibacter muris]MCU0077827.1 AAA family ATPase [Extibacter muris]